MTLNKMLNMNHAVQRIEFHDYYYVVYFMMVQPTHQNSDLANKLMRRNVITIKYATQSGVRVQTYMHIHVPNK